MAITKTDCMQRFVRMSAEACARGWHEANGGNLSYRLSDADVAQCRADLDFDGAWHELQASQPSLAGAFFLMTASGAYLSNIAYELDIAAGIIEIDEDGSAWRPVWGYADGACPSSELETHLAAYAAAEEDGRDACRVVYHAHCPNILALSAVMEPDARMWTRMLWQIMSESIVVFPQGIGVLPFMVPGSLELAQAALERMAEYKACVWAHHGIMARATSFDEAFGIIDTIEKAAAVYLQARSANGGAEPQHLVTDEQLRATCARYGITPREEYLN